MPHTDTLDPAACYRAAAGRDPRWDGRIYLAVLTTGIYCRPSCPARKPHPQNCRFYPSAAAAVAAGFRACKRCRPDALPGSRHWDARGDLAARAVRLLARGVVDEAGVAGLAGRLHVSERHLHRVLVAEVGASPHQLNRSRRAQTARLLIEQTRLPLTEVAFAAGFASIRQFNDVMRAEFAMTPSQLRRSHPASRSSEGSAQGVPAEAADGHAGPVVVLRLRHRAPLCTPPLRRFLAAHTVPGLTRHDEGIGEGTREGQGEGPGEGTREGTGEHSRPVPAAHGPAAVAVTLGAGATLGAAPDQVVARLRLADLSDLGAVVARVRRWLDLDADPLLIDEALGADRLLQPLVGERPGLRVPGTVDGFETAVLAVLGQQVSLRTACTFAGRLVAAYGCPAPDGLTAFPTPAALASAGPEEVRASAGITTARGRTVHALAEAVATGLDLDPGADAAATRPALLALPGIGPWTAEYVALRALGDPDAFPADDLVLQRALGVRTARAAIARAEPWRPWRGYALLHLWTREVLA